MDHKKKQAFNVEMYYPVKEKAYKRFNCVKRIFHSIKLINSLSWKIKKVDLTFRMDSLNGISRENSI